MDDEIKKTLEDQENKNNAPTAEDIDATKVQLEEEKKATAAALKDLETKAAAIDDLQTKLTEAKQANEASVVELAALKADRDDALSHYLDMAKAANPNIPESIIAGATIEEIDASIEKGKAIVESVKSAMESEAAKTKVPAGAPPRGGISTEGLSAREKIALGIKPKGGS